MANKPVIVCVDDDEAMLGTVVRCLKREQIEIRSTLSASEALGWIAADDIAVLVSDYDMPEMTGAQLAGHAKRIAPRPCGSCSPASALSRRRSTASRARCFATSTSRSRTSAAPGGQQAVQRHEELLALSGDRQRRERREAIRAALEAEYPGISEVHRGEQLELPSDPWSEAAALGLTALDRRLESG